MKKIIYLVVVLGLIFVSACTPMTDINNEIDAKATPIVGNANFTLTDVDYDALDLSYGSFSNLADAKSLLPPYLKSKYPVWGKGSSALIGYKLYVGSAPGVSDYTYADEYSLETIDYASSGSSVKGFYPDVTPSDYLADILAANITSPEDGQIELVKYIQYTEVPTIVSSKIYFEENFDFGATAGDLLTVSGGNWLNHSGADNQLQYATTSLSMTDYPSTAIGGSINIVNGDSEDVNSAFTAISSGNVYASALVNLSSVAGGTYFFHLMNDGYGYTARVGAKDDGSGKILFSIAAASGAPTNYGTTSYDLNTTYLLVASYNIDNGISNLHVLTSPVATEPATPETTSTGNSGYGVERVGVRQGSNGASATIDGIRVASSWTSIMSNEVLEDVITGDKEYSKVFYAWTGSKWDIPEGSYFLESEDYDVMGTEYGQPGYYNNFGSTISPDDYVPTFLDIKYPYGQEGDELIVIYDYYSSSSGAQLRGNLYIVIDGAWTGFKTTINTLLQFGHDGNTWVPDNTIKMEFSSVDYDYVVSALTGVSGYENAVSNLSSYGNFSLFNWTEVQIDKAIDAVLQHNYPGMEEGQKFAVTIYVYDGSSHNLLINYVLSGGVYVRND